MVIDDVLFLTLSKSVRKRAGSGWYDSSRYLLRLQDGPVTVFLNKKISLIQKIDLNLRACDNNQQTPSHNDKNQSKWKKQPGIQSTRGRDVATDFL